MSTHDDDARRRVAFISCSGGGVIDALCGLAVGHGWPIDVVGVVTDRPCGAEATARRHGVPQTRIEEEQGERWSCRAADALAPWRADVVVLLFLRRVGSSIWRDLGSDVWNLHPSLLPAHPGIGALERSFDDKRSEWLGTTLHVAEAECDRGPVLAQARFRRREVETIDDARHVSFLQKLILLAETLHRWPAVTAPPTWHGRYRPWQPSEAVIDAVATLGRPVAEACR